MAKKAKGPVRTSGWDQKSIAATLRRAHKDIKAPMTIPQLEAWSAKTGEPVPGQRTVVVYFGSWSAACKAAKVPVAVPTGEVTGPKPLDARVCWAALNEFLHVCADKNIRPTLERYEVMSRDQGWPARNTVMLRLGLRFTDALAEAPQHRVKVSAKTAPHRRRTELKAPTTKQIVTAMGLAAGTDPGRFKVPTYKAWARKQPTRQPTVEEIRERFGSWEAACKAAGLLSSRPSWTKRSVIEALNRAYAELGDPFTGYRYKELVQDTGDPTLPSPDTVARVLGSWRKACDVIGAEPAAPAYSDSDVAAAIAAAKRAARGKPLTQQRYRIWHHEQVSMGRSVPTLNTIARRAGSWSEAVGV